MYAPPRTHTHAHTRAPLPLSSWSTLRAAPRPPFKRTAIRYNQLDPLWQSIRVFDVTPLATDYVEVSVIDKDLLVNDFVGTVTIPGTDLIEQQQRGEKKGALVEYVVQCKRKKHNTDYSPTLTIQILRCGPVPSKPLTKRLFLIRHGESKWNSDQAAFKRKKSIKGAKQMARQKDHELTQAGVDQAMELNKAWTGVDSAKLGADDKQRVQDFVQTKEVYASPLTRALETAVLALEGHEGLASAGLALLPCIREIKNMGSYDTVGEQSGADICTHTKAKLAELLDKDRAEALMAPDIRVDEAGGKWWTPLELSDKETDINARFDDLWQRMRFASESSTCASIRHTPPCPTPARSISRFSLSLSRCRCACA